MSSAHMQSVPNNLRPTDRCVMVIRCRFHNRPLAIPPKTSWSYQTLVKTLINKAFQMRRQNKQPQKSQVSRTAKKKGPETIPLLKKATKKATKDSGGTETSRREKVSEKDKDKDKDKKKLSTDAKVINTIAKKTVIENVKTSDENAKKTVSKQPAQRGRRYSLMNLTRLVQDGRKKPDQYRKYAIDANSPSQLSFQAVTEFYDQDSDHSFINVDTVYSYRGYKRLNKIDEGAFGIVYRGVRESDRMTVAIKEVDLSKRRAKRIEETKRELFVLQKLDSPYIVKLIEHFVFFNTLVIIMEFCEGSNITSYLKEVTLDEEDIKFLFKQMVIGLMMMHRLAIAHRDVKLNNFLLDGSKKTVKVADFGLSVVSYKPNKTLQLCKTYCGTEPYMAPEILRRNSRGFRQYNPYHADIWSLGICLYAMLTRTFPFKINLTGKDLYKHQVERRWKLPRDVKEKYSEELQDLIWHMLDPEPDRRITILGVISHPWFNKGPYLLNDRSSSN